MKTARDEVMQQYKRDFYKVYHSQILPILEKFETERKQKLACVVIIAIFTLVILSILIVCLTNQKSEMLRKILSYTAFGIGIVNICIILFIIDNFIRRLKKSCMGHIIKAFGNLSWNTETNVISNSEIRNSELFESFNSRTSDDSFTGEYKGVNFKICETHIWREEGNGKNKQSYEIFEGVLVKFDFNKSINAKTIISTKEKGIKFSGPLQIFCLIAGLGINLSLLTIMALAGINILEIVFIGIVMLVAVIFALGMVRKGRSKKLKELKLEDPEFKKHYKAFSSDQVEGRYLITPAFMERFKHIQTAFKAKRAECAFYDHYILFALSTNKNLFEIGGLFHSLKDPKQMDDFFNELTSIMCLIDKFKLTEHTGL